MSKDYVKTRKRLGKEQEKTKKRQGKDQEAHKVQEVKSWTVLACLRILSPFCSAGNKIFLYKTSLFKKNDLNRNSVVKIQYFKLESLLVLEVFESLVFQFCSSCESCPQETFGLVKNFKGLFWDLSNELSNCYQRIYMIVPNHFHATHFLKNWLAQGHSSGKCS